MTAAITAAVVVAGGAAYAASQSAGAAKDAANTQAAAARDANNTQLAMYDTTRADQAPWRGAGGQAVDALSKWYGLGGVNADGTPGSATTPDYNKILSNLPGYQFQTDQGNQAVQRNLAATGLLQSGAAGKALQQYGQGMASNYATQYVNGLQSLAGLGQTSVANTGAIGANTANQIGANQIYAGNAQASGYVGEANAINSGLSGITSAYGMYRNYQNSQPQWNGSNAALATMQSNQAADQFANQPVAPLNLGGP